MPNQTPNLSMPYIMPAQAQKHVTHNEAIELLDMVVQLALQSADMIVPPSAPEEGQAWAVPDGATGAWEGQFGLLATWRGGGWHYVAPQDGWVAWVIDRSQLHVYIKGSWAAQSEATELNNLAGLGINTESDASNRLSLSSPATLLSHEGAGHQLKVNKAGLAETASMLFQSDFSGRAELGLAGSDDFSVKVSADGATWTTALGIDGATGNTRIDNVLCLSPGSAPTNPSAGDIYFDATTSKLRCFDGAVWQDLF